ncbi:MAG: CPBP family intramembrane metalloprotease [Gracilibacteraceae bacterium]|jgi:membrane protease YdiL (CAAX protease family)|nr:CPBP family intramembrane metalloprotease [Gracilibacteraceae bacterium]
MLKSLSNLESDRFGFKAIFHAVMGMVILYAGLIITPLLVDSFYSITKLEQSLLTLPISLALNIPLTLLLVYLYITKILRKPLSEFRICKPKKNPAIWILCAVVVPVSVSVSFLLLSSGSFIASDLSSEQMMQRVSTAIIGSCMLFGITEEWIFRGLIMRVVENRWNRRVAAVVPSVVFACLHINSMQNPGVEDIAMMVAAVSAIAIAFSLMTYHSGSIWPAAIAHGIWNLIIVGGILKIGVDPKPAIFTYAFESDSVLFTGGAVGIESSLATIIAFSAVSILAWLLQRGKSAE